MSVNEPQIVLSGVSFRHDARTVLDGIDLTAVAGERLGIVGRSGVGKSTLLQILAGLATPTGGNFLVDGRDVRGPVPLCTVMFQRPALLPWAGVLDNVLLPARLSGRLRHDRDSAASHARRILFEVGLADRIDAKPHELSGGQQQRVALARALASEPRILLLDEPFSALDPETRAGLRADVLRLARERSLTLVIVTHDLADVAALAQRVVVLGGRPARVTADFALGADAEGELRRRIGALDRTATARAAA